MHEVPFLHKELKKRITITVDEKIISNARSSGIKNISNFTESMLGIFSAPNGKTKNEMIGSFQSFFEIIQNFLKRYDCSIKIGFIPNQNNLSEQGKIVRLYNDQLKIEDENGKETLTSINEVISYLDPFEDIIDELLLTLTRSAQANKEKIEKLEFARKFFKTFFDIREYEN